MYLLGKSRILKEYYMCLIGLTIVETRNIDMPRATGLFFAPSLTIAT